jgi:hypothetical protein
MQVTHRAINIESIVQLTSVCQSLSPSVINSFTATSGLRICQHLCQLLNMELFAFLAELHQGFFQCGRILRQCHQWVSELFAQPKLSENTKISEGVNSQLLILLQIKSLLCSLDSFPIIIYKASVPPRHIRDTRAYFF